MSTSSVEKPLAGGSPPAGSRSGDQVPAGARYARLSVTVGTNAVLIAALAIGGEAALKPASANDVAAVAQRVVV